MVSQGILSSGGYEGSRLVQFAQRRRCIGLRDAAACRGGTRGRTRRIGTAHRSRAASLGARLTRAPLPPGSRACAGPLTGTARAWS